MRQIDMESDKPLYYQVKESLYENIKSGLWEHGTKIPSEIELAKSYGISRITVRQAILELVRQGLLYRRSGKGTFVASPKVKADFISTFYPKGLSNKHKIISIERILPPKSTEQILGVKSDEFIFEIRRLRYFNDEAAVLERSYIRESICPQLLEDKPEGKLFEYLQKKYNILIDQAETFVDPVVVGEYEAKHFGIKKGTPALLLQRLNYSQKKVIVLSDSIIRGDRCRLHISTFNMDAASNHHIDFI